METIRTFVAIKIPPLLVTALRDMLQELHHTSGNVKWVKPESVHITLKFIGEIPAADVEQVCKGVETACRGKIPFTLLTAGKGAFPSLKRPKVFWVGLSRQNMEKLHALQRDVEGELEKAGYPRERRPFKAHLTVGRIRRPERLEKTLSVFTGRDFPQIEIPVNEILVMRSQLTPRGAVYSVQKSFRLGIK